ncbi:MAG TPA: lipopolysaccharide heptosyltransferase II [Ktedonobacteraceae bacterium]|nr:lipopolysaccharide heptosyltransferase II [Ktedonobacteraceae bacterium]
MLDDYGYPLRPDSRGALRKKGIRASKMLLSKCIYLCMCVVGGLLWLSRGGKKYLPLSPRNTQPRRILVIRLDLIGDLVLSMTVVRALKRSYAGAQIDLLALPSSAQIVRDDPDLCEIISYDPNAWRRPKALFQARNWLAALALMRRLRSRRYDIAVSVFGNWAAIMAVLSGAQRRVGFGREGYPGFMTDSLAGRHWQPGERLHEVDYCLKLARAAGVSVTPGDRIPRLFVAPATRLELEALLHEARIQEDKPLIACHVSSNNGQSKRWPIPYWATLLDRLIREQGVQVVLTGAPNDLPLIERITSRMQEQPVNLAGKTSLEQLAALLQRADLLISGDSGPMHIAAAVGTPLIAIHGPTDPTHSGPVSPSATILKSGIWCSPCYNAKDTADCRFYTTQCMKNITPAQVFQVVKEKLW